MTAVTAVTHARPRTRRLERTIAGIGAALALVFQGGFAAVVAGADEDTLRADIIPALEGAGVALPAGGEIEAVQTLAGWFGFSLVAVLAFTALGFFFSRIRPTSRSAAWWFVAAGLACLVGSQLVLYPLAFLFFLAAGLFAARPLDGSPS
ncbi:hypothetical protein [Microbacterium excoecariae]|uniref:hypothetical protein n=1 Tax=Microbacterium excoecariae TaxID=2715210 RepID=UPI00140B7D91|nr:hypothetical protein [Microbacterium excoecariae]NHI17397.1 hypothetical protein [Microbacterium excoecariae]